MNKKKRMNTGYLAAVFASSDRPDSVINSSNETISSRSGINLQTKVMRVNGALFRRPINSHSHVCYLTAFPMQ